MVSRIRNVVLVSISFCLLFSLVFIVPECTAQLSWSDNFNDGNYDGWIVISGSYTAAGGSLNATSTNNYIYHNSTAAFGFWSFDLFVDESEGSPTAPSWDIAIIRIGAPDDPNPNGYVLSIYAHDGQTTQEIYIVRIDAGYAVSPRVCEDSTISSFNGWQAINITRSSAGLFEVFVNGTSRMQGIDTEHTTSNQFMMNLIRGSIFDNLVVSGVEVTPPPPPVPGFPAVAIAIGVSLALGIGLISQRRRKIK